MSAFWNWIKGEPVVVIMGVVQGAITLITEFGVPLTGGQKSAIIVFAGAILAAITRQMVTPTAKLNGATTQGPVQS